MDDFGFKKLKVYHKSLDLAIDLSKKASQFPIGLRRISDQLIGASVSIPLNIAEGTGRISDRDKVSFYKNSRGSGFETVAVLEICYGLKLINKFELKIFSSKLVEISKMLSALIRSKSNH